MVVQMPKDGSKGPIQRPALPVSLPLASSSIPGTVVSEIPANTSSAEEDPAEMVSFKNGWLMAGLGYIIFGIVCLANAYVIVCLGMGTAS